MQGSPPPLSLAAALALPVPSGRRSAEAFQGQAIFDSKIL